MPLAFFAAAALIVIGVGVSFCLVTTFTGDDHLFLAFARYAPNPIVAFVRDQHGGEFYRPFPMVIWWGLGQLAGGSAMPFAALSFALHLTVSVEVGALALAVGRAEDAATASNAPSGKAAAIASLLFFIAPLTQEAAFWYAASTDLFATAFGVGAVLALLRRRPWTATLLFVGACWSKETALVIPALAALALRAQAPGRATTDLARRVAPLAGVALVYLIVRAAVLGGLGRSGDDAASLGGKLLQLGSGLLHLPLGSVIMSEPLAGCLGLVAWVLLVLGALRTSDAERGKDGRRDFRFPLAWVVLSLLPLLAAPWAVGARYFYLAAVGVACLAAQVLARRPPPLLVATLAMLAGLTFAQDQSRRADVVSYDTRLSAARRAVADGLANGATTFHIAAGIKDLDLAVKEDPRFVDREADLLVLGDVPASFVVVPESRVAAVDFLLAQPPLPPSGAYRFGARRIVGLARRGDDPTLDEVVAHLPDIRFIRLRLGPGGRIIFRDLTESISGTSADSQ